LFAGGCTELEIMLSEPDSERQILHVFSHMWKIDLKDKHMHK
jgi:hypothetical protein